MGVTNSNKQISTQYIECDGTFEVLLALTAAPDIVSHPTDIVLILDRSGSMAGSPLANLKSGAKKFIDIIEEATDGTPDGMISSGSRIGIVSFASTATQNTQLITSVADLKSDRQFVRRREHQPCRCIYQGYGDVRPCIGQCQGHGDVHRRPNHDRR